MASLRLESEMGDDGILRITLDGRFDVDGAMAVDMKFATLTGARKAAVLVDMSGVSFLASLGIRTLLASAKGAAARGGRLVLVKPQPLVAEVLTTSGIASLIPMFDDSELAITALREITAA